MIKLLASLQTPFNCSFKALTFRPKNTTFKSILAWLADSSLYSFCFTFVYGHVEMHQLFLTPTIYPHSPGHYSNSLSLVWVQMGLREGNSGRSHALGAALGKLRPSRKELEGSIPVCASPTNPRVHSSYRPVNDPAPAQRQRWCLSAGLMKTTFILKHLSESERRLLCMWWLLRGCLLVCDGRLHRETLKREIRDNDTAASSHYNKMFEARTEA